MAVDVEGQRSAYRVRSDNFVTGESYARKLGVPERDQSPEASQMEQGHHDVPRMAEVMARGNVPLQAVYSFGTQGVELRFACLNVSRKSLGTTEVMEFRGPYSDDENCEKQLPAKGYADEEPGHPKVPVCVHLPES